MRRNLLPGLIALALSLSLPTPSDAGFHSPLVLSRKFVRLALAFRASPGKLGGDLTPYPALRSTLIRDPDSRFLLTAALESPNVRESAVLLSHIPTKARSELELLYADDWIESESYIEFLAAKLFAMSRHEKDELLHGIERLHERDFKRELEQPLFKIVFGKTPAIVESGLRELRWGERASRREVLHHLDDEAFGTWFQIDTFRRMEEYQAEWDLTPGDDRPQLLFGWLATLRADLIEMDVISSTGGLFTGLHVSNRRSGLSHEDYNRLIKILAFFTGFFDGNTAPSQQQTFTQWRIRQLASPSRGNLLAMSEHALRMNDVPWMGASAGLLKELSDVSQNLRRVLDLP